MTPPTPAKTEKEGTEITRGIKPFLVHISWCASNEWPPQGEVFKVCNCGLDREIELLDHKARKAELCGRMVSELRRLREIVCSYDADSIDALLKEYDHE